MKYDQKQIKNFLNVINKIQNIRSKNNKNWMDILRVAVKHAPHESKKLMIQITKKDMQISNTFISALKKMGTKKK